MTSMHTHAVRTPNLPPSESSDDASASVGSTVATALLRAEPSANSGTPMTVLVCMAANNQALHARSQNMRVRVRVCVG